MILNYETWDATLRCIKSIEKAENTESVRVYLIDNASSSDMPVALKQYINDHDVVYISSKENRGYAAGNNLGIRKALEDQCGYILISNNDIVYRKDSIETMCEFLKEKHGGIVGPQVVDPQGKHQPSVAMGKTGMKEIFRFYTVLKCFQRKAMMKYQGMHLQKDSQFRVFHVSGCCFMMDRQTAELLYPLDENTFLYDEELIIGIRMQLANKQTWYNGKAIVEHHHGYTTQRNSAFMQKCIRDSEQYYCREYLHASRVQIALLYWYRKMLYLFRSVRYETFRKQWKWFRRMTKKELLR